jgi:isopentenyl diphosphate isomerase/L-lactate dehydrogenase-like FMN-dependent dehydrogenase
LTDHNLSDKVADMLGGFTYKLRDRHLLSVADYREAARRRVPRMVWEYVEGGADDQVTVSDNRRGFERWAFRARMLQGSDSHDLASTVGGVPLSMPIVLGPTGFSGLANWRGDVAAARAAETLGTRYVLSTASSWSLEEVATETAQDHFFQLYPTGSADRVAELMDRAWQAGYRVLMVTVDVPARGNRESEVANGMGVPPVLTPARILDAARRPRWTYGLLRHRRVGGRSLVAETGVRAAVASAQAQAENMQATLSWDDLAWMRERWNGPLFIKGIIHPADAVQAADIGADGIVVSNHGGRQLDYAQATIDALPEIVAAVGDRVEVLLDGGVRRGTDIVKALALGARAVMIGRPYVYGLAVDGEAGVAKILQILRDELRLAMVLLGIQRPDQLDRSVLVPRLAGSETGAWSPHVAAPDVEVHG